MKLETPSAQDALPGYLNEADMRQHDRIALQKSESLKAINSTNITHKAFEKAGNYTINRPEKLRYPGHIISLGSVTMLHVRSRFIVFHQLFHLIVQATLKQIRTVLKWKALTAIGCLVSGKVMTSRHRKLMEPFRNT